MGKVHQSESTFSHRSDTYTYARYVHIFLVAVSRKLFEILFYFRSGKTNGVEKKEQRNRIFMVHKIGCRFLPFIAYSCFVGLSIELYDSYLIIMARDIRKSKSSHPPCASCSFTLKNKGFAAERRWPMRINLLLKWKISTPTITNQKWLGNCADKD